MHIATSRKVLQVSIDTSVIGCSGFLDSADFADSADLADSADFADSADSADSWIPQIFGFHL